MREAHLVQKSDDCVVSDASEASPAIRQSLLSLAEPEYREFLSALIPTTAPDRVLGVRSPALRALARELRGSPEAEAFLTALPHRFHEEYMLHAYLLAYEREAAGAFSRLEALLPFVENWAVCDAISLPCFCRHRPALLKQIPHWLEAKDVYSLRFGIKQLMDHFLDKDFSPACLELVGAIQSKEYYVNMMIAWYFATALAKQWDATLPWLTQRRLAPWVHRKTIQKAVESRRISEGQKAFLRSLRNTGN
ncbi:MAG: DNA alkylation repair protein [Oscillospiraceae bacterium]|nr:DNA alkylation repair protein [Oscillospiraceae bacterium]